MTRSSSEARVAIAVHGGAGDRTSAQSAETELERDYHHAMQRALRAGHEILKHGGSSVDAVVAAVVVLEDCPLFNAACGSVLNADGQVEMDAALMNGWKRQAGAAACVTGVKNPIQLARAVMQDSPHVLLCGPGAVAFARERGLATESPDYFITEARKLEWQRCTEEQVVAAGLGTVGAVALDAAGNVAAATSTGGMVMKRWGRIGDSPIVGAGTYADNRAAAVSATGHGEVFLRAAAAHDVCARMQYLGLSVEEAATQVIEQGVAALGGKGGLIAVDGQGKVAFHYNTPIMYRGSIDTDGRMFTAIGES